MSIEPKLWKNFLYIFKAIADRFFINIVDLVNELLKPYDKYIVYFLCKQTPSNCSDCFNQEVYLIEIRKFCNLVNSVIKIFFASKSIV